MCVIERISREVEIRRAHESSIIKFNKSHGHMYITGRRRLAFSAISRCDVTSARARSSLLMPGCGQCKYVARTHSRGYYARAYTCMRVMKDERERQDATWDGSEGGEREFDARAAHMHTKRRKKDAAYNNIQPTISFA